MRRFWTILLTVATLLPAGAALTAVSLTPRSANALPVFEITTGGAPIRISAAELGARRSESGLVIDDEQFANGVARLGRVFNHPAVPATYELVDDRVQFKAGASGFEIDPVALKSLLMRALRGSRSNLKLPTRDVAAPGPPQYAIVVRLQDFLLDVYEGLGVSRNYQVGVGALSFPTPPGAYYIRSKAKDPSWRNPGSPWARSMPAYIAPGPRNPLGSRALRLDRGALVIHGTPQPWTIGQRASQRLHPDAQTRCGTTLRDRSRGDAGLHHPLGGSGGGASHRTAVLDSRLTHQVNRVRCERAPRSNEMCRIPKLVIVADEARGAELRRRLSSLEYDIVAVVASTDELGGITADVVVLWDPDPVTLKAARERGLKTVAIGGAEGADLRLDTEDAASLKTRIWELFRPR